jgi:hypothetical protein
MRGSLSGDCGTRSGVLNGERMRGRESQAGYLWATNKRFTAQWTRMAENISA